MNKELINKYKPEFDHWLNGGTLLFSVITSDEDDFMYTIWYRVDNNTSEKCKAEYLFNLTNKEMEYYKPKFVINDEFVEFRKALAEGKIIESKVSYTSCRGCTYGQELPWNVDTSGKFNGTADLYRIKPAEPKFKVGDFVRYVNSSDSLALEINNINCDRYYFVNSNISCLEHELIPWKPIKGEWCWFWDAKINEDSHLSKFNSITKDQFQSSSYADWNFCEPFLNSKPLYLRDM